MQDLFTGGVLWLSQSFGFSRRRVVMDVLVWLKDAENDAQFDSEKILSLLNVNDPNRIEAEELLCHILAQSIDKPRAVRKWQGRIGRHTDWGATTVGQLSGRRGQYRNIEHSPTPDLETISALATRAVEWEAELDLVGGLIGVDKFQNRRKALSDSLEKLGSRVQYHPAPLTDSVLHKLDHIEGGTHLKSLIFQCDRYKDQPLDDDDAQILFDVCNKECADNTYYVFEIVSALAVVRCLSNLGWTVDRKEAASAFSVSSEKKKNIKVKYGFHLEKNGWKVSISKEAPELSDDTTRPSKVAMFGKNYDTNRSRIQPDIMMRFHGPDGNNFWIVGDAKYSSNEDGNYARTGFDAVMKYIVAYAPKIGLQVDQHSLNQNTIGQEKMPAALLFSSQNLQGGRNGGDTLRLVEGFDMRDIEAVWGDNENENETRLKPVIQRISTALKRE